MQTAVNLLPNHFRGIYREMRGELEKKVFDIDFKVFTKRVLEETILEEFNQEIIGEEDYVRSEERRNLRNGYYYRSLDTVYGWIKDLKVPRPRYGGFSPRCLKKYSRRQEALNRLIQECFFRGISTRDVEHVLSALGDIQVSSSTVSRLTSQWDSQIKSWHQRKLYDDYIYLMADGIWIKNRFLCKKRRLILVVYGIRENGLREVIDYRFAQSEKEEHWLAFFTNLQHRGLEGNHLKLITTDGCGGLGNALAIAFPTTPHQLCWAHKMRNILKSVREEDKKKVQKGLSPLFNQDMDEQKITRLINKWCSQWKNDYPKAVYCLQKDLDRLLLYLDCPVNHHRAVRTSNHIERQFKEYRRRMRAMEMTPHQKSADKVLFALTMFRNEKLRKYPLLFTQNTLH